MNVRFHVQRGGFFYGYDRHGDDVTLWVSFSDLFVCAWDSAEEAAKYVQHGDVVRVSVDGAQV